MQSIEYFARARSIFSKKVFNILHLNIWGSIYPTYNKYFLHVQRIQYFAPIYLGVHIYNLEKYFFHVQSIQYFAPKYLVVHISNF